MISKSLVGWQYPDLSLSGWLHLPWYFFLLNVFNTHTFLICFNSLPIIILLIPYDPWLFILQQSLYSKVPLLLIGECSIWVVVLALWLLSQLLVYPENHTEFIPGTLSSWTKEVLSEIYT